ncbi:uncharacterized protein LOC132197245 [Neocloeon triangulifer]|uniref:uncharacterized protein LOC132197245 n=1 Tax=Neocloeon triangulifer TaxID=2078957 RepID=UPI00286F7C5C|nr:uncharacterized protein LOC132197245 [Neocloeon triangulifer]
MKSTYFILLILALAANSYAVNFYCPPSETMCSANRRAYSVCPVSGYISSISISAELTCAADSYCFEGFKGPRGPCIPILCMAPTNGPVSIPQVPKFYYTCQNNTALTLTISKCPDGNLFNSNKQICEAPASLTGCSDAATTVVPSTVTTTSRPITTTANIPLNTNHPTAPVTTSTTTTAPEKPRKPGFEDLVISDEDRVFSSKFSNKFFKFIFL